LDKTIQVWDASTGLEMLPALQGHDAAILSVAFSPDGSKIVSGSLDKTIRVWDASTGLEMLPALQGHDAAILSVAFSPDASKIVSGSNDKTIRVWDASTGLEMLPALQGHDAAILSVTFSPDGSKIVSGSEDKTIRVWDASTGVKLPGAETVVDDISRSAMNDLTFSLKDDWFIDINTGCYLGSLPVGGHFHHWNVHRSTYVGSTNDHKLVIIHFPVQWKS
jgi:WD40 repeat protein